MAFAAMPDHRKRKTREEKDKTTKYPPWARVARAAILDILDMSGYVWILTPKFGTRILQFGISAQSAQSITVRTLHSPLGSVSSRMYWRALTVPSKVVSDFDGERFGLSEKRGRSL